MRLNSVGKSRAFAMVRDVDPMTGLALFFDKLHRQPGRALWDLAMDYATYVGMCLFFIWLWAMRGPLWLLGRTTSRTVRRALVGAVARVARG